MRCLRPLVICCALILLPSCGADSPGAFEVEWTASKPEVRIGRVQATVIERPSPDRARIQARWENRSGADNCALELVVPDGVVVLEGERQDQTEPEGEHDGSEGEHEVPDEDADERSADCLVGQDVGVVVEPGYRHPAGQQHPSVVADEVPDGLQLVARAAFLVDAEVGQHISFDVVLIALGGQHDPAL